MARPYPCGRSAGRRVPRDDAPVDASADLIPYVYARRSLEAVEPNALIVSEYDGRTFALWFYKATEFWLDLVREFGNVSP